MSRLTRSALPVVLLTGAVFVLMGLRVGFVLDDYFQLAVLSDPNPRTAQSSLFLWSWARESEPPLFGNPVQGNWLPWWTSPNLRINFFRPLPSLLHLLDFRLYGLDVRGWRITTLAIWLLLLWAVFRLYKELAGQAGASPGVALLAGLFFAVDESHVWNTIWLAARHSLLAVLFVVAAVGCYLVFRRSGSRQSLAAALLFTILGLFSSEVAVGILAWVIAYELTFAQDEWKARLRAAAPFFLVVLAYVIFYAVSGFGSRANGWYIDPASQPIALLDGLPTRLPFLIQGLITPIPPELGPIFGFWSIALPALAVALLIVLAFVPRLRRDPVFRFVGLATLLSLLPTSLAMPINYLLLLPSVGAAWLFASVVMSWWKSRRESTDRASLLTATAAVFLLIVHGLIAPLMFALDVQVLHRAHQRPADLVRTAQVPPGASRVVLLTASNRLFASYMGLVWPMLAPPPRPEAVWIVSPAKGPHRFLRTGERSFRLEIPTPGVLDSLWDRIVNDGSGLARGSRFHQGAMQVEVLRTEGESIREVEVTIDRPLDAPDVCLLAWNGERLAPVQVPGIGGTAVLEPLTPGPQAGQSAQGEQRGRAGPS